MSNNFENLGYRVGLHEEVTIIYVVDGFEALLYTSEGDHLVKTCKGRTVSEALANLDQEVSLMTHESRQQLIQRAENRPLLSREKQRLEERLADIEAIMR